MKGPPQGGTAAGGRGRDPGGTGAPALQAGGRAATADPVGSGGDSEWSRPDWASGRTQPGGSAKRKAWRKLCHGQSCRCLHPGDQTRLEVAAGPLGAGG